MTAPVCRVSCLAVLVILLGTCRAADTELSRVQVSHLGKAATALVEVTVPGGKGYGTAFCIHPSGLFVSNEHVTRLAGPGGTVTLVLNPSLKTQRVLHARVLRADRDKDLALLRVEGVRDLPALTLGSADDLDELMEVIAFGFPFGTMLNPERGEYPAVSVNVGSITALRRRQGVLHRIQVDAVLNPGNSGGPVLDRKGQVVGVVVAGVRGAGVNLVIPVTHLTAFLSRLLEVQFEPPLLGPAELHKPVRFEARVTTVLPPVAPLTVDLVLKPAKGRERTQHMQAEGDTYRVSAVPMPPPPGGYTVTLHARFEDGVLEGTAADQAFKVGAREVRLSEVRGIRQGDTPQVLLHDRKRLKGTPTGLEAVPVRLAGQTLSVNLAKAVEVKCAPPTDQLSCTLLVHQGGKEVFRQSRSLIPLGLIKNPGFEDGIEGWSGGVYAGARSWTEFDTDVAREGWQAVRVTATKPSDTSFSQEVMLKPGQWYRFSGWVRTEGLNPRGAGVYGTFQIHARAMNDVIAKGENHGGDTEWTEVHITFQTRANDGLTRIVWYFVGFGEGTGTVWIDDLKLVEVSPPAP